MELKLVKPNIMKHSEYHQFYLGILLQNDSYIYEVYNKQIGIMYDTYTNKLSSMFDEEYNNYSDTGLLIEGFILGKTYNLLEYNMPNEVINIFIEHLENKFYIKYTGDLYYIPKKHENKHVWSDIYIIGYSNDVFYAVGKTPNSCFEKYEISFEDIIESIKKRYDSNFYSEFTYSLEIDFYKCRENTKYDVNIEKIYQKIHDYLNPIKRIRYLLGVDIYKQILSNWMRFGIDKNQLLYIYDRMCLMQTRLIYLNKFSYIANKIENQYRKLVSRFSLLLSQKNPREIMDGIIRLIEEEKKVLSLVLDELDKSF